MESKTTAQEMMSASMEKRDFSARMSQALARADDHRRKWARVTYPDFLLLEAEKQPAPITWLKSIRGPAPACACASWLLRRIAGKVSLDG